MEAGCGVRHRGRRFYDFGIEVRLIHAKFVRPYVKSAKNDARDAEAICEAVHQCRRVKVLARKIHEALAGADQTVESV